MQCNGISANPFYIIPVLLSLSTSFCIDHLCDVWKIFYEVRAVEPLLIQDHLEFATVDMRPLFGLFESSIEVLLKKKIIIHHNSENS